MKTKAIHASAEVHYQITVLNPDGSFARVLPRKRNLILDQGLDGIAVRTWAASFTAAAIGTGTTATKRDSGSITFSRSGSTVTASAGFFEAADVGRLLKFDSGEEVRITVFTDASTVTTSTSGTIAAAEATIWYVNQTGLATESKRSSTYSTGGGECGSTFASGAWTLKRTFVFSAESGTVNYREVGWSHTTSAGANLFGRDLLAGSGVTLVAGQQLKISVELTVAFSPAASTAWANVITGWSTSGAHGIEWAEIDTVSSSGAGVAGSLEPSVAGLGCYLSSGSNAIQAVTGGTPGTPGGALIQIFVSSGQTYVTSSFKRDFVGNLSISQGNSSAIRSIFIYGGGAGCCYRVLLSAAATKANTHTLSLTFTLSWGRVLTN